LRRGEHFGEQSAFNDLPSPFTVEATTAKVELYKIHRANFIQYFGGLDGEPLAAIRASIVLKHNWLRMKLDFLKTFSEEQL
jgi:CRP-like cAMP-binding protein